MDLCWRKIGMKLCEIFLCCLLFFVSTTKAAAPSGCDGKIDMYFVVDSSESVVVDDPYQQPLYHWKLVKQFMRGVTGNLPVSYDDCHIGVMKYSDDSHVEFSMQQYTEISHIDYHIQQMDHVGGNTNTAKALDSVLGYLLDPAEGARDNTRKVVVLISDGLANRDQQITLGKALELKNRGVDIYGVAMGGDVDEAEMTSLVSSPPEKYLIVQSFLNDPARLIEFIVYGVCDLPIPTPPPPNCDVNMDLAIVIDNSGSIKTEDTQTRENRNYDNLKNFVQSLTDILSIGENMTRVGLVRFSDRASTVLHLDSHYDKESIKRSIENMPFDGGLTNISGALLQTKRDVFNIHHGDRPDVRNVIIIIADGESNVDPHLTSKAARELKQENTRLYVVAVLTTKFDESELRDIASSPDADHYFNSPSIANLPAIRYSLLKHVCEQEILQGIEDPPQDYEPPDFGTN